MDLCIYFVRSESIFLCATKPFLGRRGEGGVLWKPRITMRYVVIPTVPRYFKVDAGNNHGANVNKHIELFIVILAARQHIATRSVGSRVRG